MDLGIRVRGSGRDLQKRFAVLGVGVFKVALKRFYPPTLGGVLDGFSNGKGENPLPFSLKRGRGAVRGVSRARFPQGPHICGSRFS